MTQETTICIDYYFCTYTDKCLADFTKQEFDKLQQQLYLKLADHLYGTVILTDFQQNNIDSLCQGLEWIELSRKMDLLYFDDDSDDDYELEVEFNLEEDHYDLDGNFVKGISKD